MKNPRIRLLLPTPVAERLQWECEFLRIDSRFFPRAQDEDLPKNRNEVIRRAVELFVARGDELKAAPYAVDMSGESTPTPFFFAKGIVGAWDYALSQHWADTYHELAAAALAWRFQRQDATAETDAALLKQLRAMPPAELGQLLRSHPNPGEFRNVLETTRNPV